MVWWIVAGLVAVPLVVAMPVALSVRDQVTQLQQVAALSRERAAGQAAALQATAAGAQAQLAGVAWRSALVRQHLTRTRARRRQRGAPAGVKPAGAA